MTPHTYTTSGTTPATHGRTLTSGTRYFEYRLAYEAEMEAYARYLPIRHLETDERENALTAWLDAGDVSSEAFQAYAAE